MKLPKDATAQLERLLGRFIRHIPNNAEYHNRLIEELEIILKLRFVDYFLTICDVLTLTDDITHMTRGSAGSSLVCYLLGITDVDPIRWQIPVARFLNPLRDDLPDVDIDFPHHQQTAVMQRIFDKWPGKSARISNYVTYKERSARREAARRLGASGRLPRNFKYEDLDIDKEEAMRIERKLIGKKRAISKHCGGILVFDHKVPKSLINADNQILLDKNEVEDLEHLKIDILANRGLSQLLEIDSETPLEAYPEEDFETSQMLCRGDVIGVTQAESPAMRRLFQAIQPQSKADCVFATALIRPVATTGRQKAAFFQDWTEQRLEDTIVYEDDAIRKIARLIDCDMYEADMYRRAFAKRDEQKVMQFMERMGDSERKEEIIQELYGLGNFGLCRAHAVNLGRLIWALAYNKAHNPKEFWRAALKHCQGSYRRWVHKTEAKNAGWDLRDLGYENGITQTPQQQYKRYGYWTQPEFMPSMFVQETWGDRVNFAGLVANGRVFKGEQGRYVTFVTLGVNNGEYVDVTIKKPFGYRDHDVVAGSGKIRMSNGARYIDCYDAKGYRLDQYLSH
jgi:DNA polymerase III alpha subunit